MPRDTLIPLERFLSRRFGGVGQGLRTIRARSWAQRFERLAGYLLQLEKQETPMDDLKLEAPAGQPIITMTRSFKAPQTLVWKAMTEREHIARWWGLRGSRLRILAHDFRVGGEWRFESGHDGGTRVFYGRYREIAPIRTYTNTFGIEGLYADDALSETHALEERDGVTHYTSVSRFDTFEARDEVVASGLEHGARQTLARLDELLAELVQAIQQQQ